MQARGMRRADLPRRGQRVIGRHNSRAGPVRDRDEALRPAQIQRPQTDLRRQLPHGVQDAEVEGLHDHPFFQFVPPDRLTNQLGETFRRWRQRYEEDGEAGLLDRRLGKASGKRVPVDRETEVEELYRNRYSGFTAKHFHEHLVRDHQFAWDYGDSALN